MVENKTAGGASGKTKAQSTQSAAGRRGTEKPKTAKAGNRPKVVKPPTINLKAEKVSAENKESMATTADKTASSGSQSAKDKTGAATPDRTSRQSKTEHAAKEQHRGGLGLMGYAGVGAVGAMTAAAVSLGVNMIGVQTPDTGALETRIEQLAANNAGTTALRQQIDVLQARQVQLIEQVGAVSGGGQADIANLQMMLEALIAETQSELDTLTQAVSDLSVTGADENATSVRAGITELGNRLASAEERLGRVATSEDLAALQGVIAQAAGETDTPGTGLSALAELGQAVSERNDALSARIDALEPLIRGLGETMTTLETRMAESLGTGASMSDIEGLGDRIASIGGQFGDLRNAVAGAQAKVDATEQLLADHDSRLAAMEADLTEVQSSLAGAHNRAASGAANEAVTALALAQLREAVQRGGEFAAPLETLTAMLGAERAELLTLSAYAQNGVRTVAELTTQFEEIVGHIIAAGGIREDAGILGRFIDNARGIVSVRPVSPVSGDTPAAIASRISGHLASGNLDAARSEWAMLPDPAQTAAGDWGELLAARADVDKALNQLTESLLADLRNATAPTTR